MQIQPPPPDSFLEPLRSRIIEGRTFTPNDYRPIVIPLQTTLSTTVLQGTANYNIPSNQRMVVMALRPICIPNLVSDVSNLVVPPVTGTTGLVVNGGRAFDLLLGIANNVRLNLKMASNTFDLFPQMAFALSDLFDQVGDEPTLADQIGILPQGTTIDMNIAFNDTAPQACGAGPANAATTGWKVGLAIVGYFVQVNTN